MDVIRIMRVKFPATAGLFHKRKWVRAAGRRFILRPWVSAGKYTGALCIS